MTKAEILDGMKEMLGDDEDLLNDIYQEYLTEAKKIFSEARVALAAKDTMEMRRAAHTLKGCSANIGAEAIRALSYDWQLAAQNAEFEKFDAYSKQLEAMFAQLQ